MDEDRRALSLALKILARRDHSEAELRGRLSAKGFLPETIDRVAVRLREAGYLDDGRFARAYVESAIRNGRGYGNRLRFDLARRGVAEELISDVLGELSAEHDEVGTLAGLLSRKFPDFVPRLADDRRKRRVMGYFQRRGFSLGAIVRVFKDMEG